MPRKFFFIVLFCALFLSVIAISQSKLRKLEIMLNVHQSKLATLENKIFKDELEFRDELDMILKELNNTESRNKDEIGKHSETEFRSTTEDEILQVLEKVRIFEDGLGKEKQYIRSQLKLFEGALDDMKRKQTNAFSEIGKETNKRLANVENKVSAGKHFINKFGEDMRNEIILINQNITDNVEVSISQMATRHEGLKQHIAENENVIAELSKSITQKATKHEVEGLKQQIAENENVIAELSKSISEKVTKHEVEGLKQQIAENENVIAVLSDKLDKLQKVANKINEAPVFDCGTWDRFELSCYKFFSNKVEWEEAVINCKLEDAYLIEIDSSVENSFIVNLTITNAPIVHYNSGPWLGASDKGTDGKWMWEYSGRNLDKSFQGWKDGEPNGGTSENCLHSPGFFEYSWNDALCSQMHMYVCEKPVTVK